MAEMKGLRRHYNWDITTKTNLTYPEHSSQSGVCSLCIRCGKCEIGLKAKIGRTLYPEPFGFDQFGAEKRLPGLQDIQILPELFGVGNFFTKVKTECEIGGFKCSVPVAIGAMGSTKVASTIADTVSQGAATAGIVRVIGENIMATFGREGLKCMIDPFLNHYEKLGAIIVQASYTDMKLKALETGVELGAQAIELKFGQGAKQGLGGEITFEGKVYAKKYEELGYLIIEHDEKTFERHTHPGSLIRQTFVEQLKKYSELGVPIWIKIGVGSGIYEFLKLCQEVRKKENIKIECVTIDGHGGGTGMSPWIIMNETSLPSIVALEKIGKMKLDFDILVAGGFADGVDAAKAMMLGANGVAMARPFLIAANTDRAKGIVNFIKALKEELQMVCCAQRVYDVKELQKKRKNLIALSQSASKMFGLPQKL